MPLIFASGASVISSGSGLSIAPVIETARINISGTLHLESGATITTSGSGITFANTVTFNLSTSGRLDYPNIRSGTILNPVISGAIIDAATINNATFNPPLTISNTLQSGAQIHNPIISGNITFVSGANILTSGSGVLFTTNVIVSGLIQPSSVSMWGAIPYEYYVYKNSDNVIQIRNNSGIIQYSGTDVGLVINSMLSGANSSISIGFQPNYYSGATDVQNNGRAHVIWYGNGSQIGMKMKINSSGSTSRAANNTFDSFTFSGTGAGLVFDNARNCATTNCRFHGCIEAISFESSNLWTEIWRITNTSFNNCVKSIIFKEPTGDGTGSYVNGLMDQVTFNVDAAMVVPYTHMEVQKTAQINESKIINTRFWFTVPSGIGLHAQSGCQMARAVFSKPVFENFSTNNNDAIRIDPSAGPLYFDGRPVTQGSTFANNVVNSGNVHILGQSSTWRQTNAVSIPAGADTFSSSTTVVSTASDDFEGIPNMYVIIGGTVAAGETVTVELTSNAIHVGGTGAAFTITKTYKFTGTYPLELLDYQNLTSSNYRYIISNIAARVKSSVGSSTATVLVVSLTGGTGFQSNPALSGLRWLGAMNSGANLVVGAATALPATPKGYITVTISGANMFMPYYISG